LLQSQPGRHAKLARDRPNSVFVRVFINELIKPGVQLGDVNELIKPGVQLGDVIVDARERVAELAATHIDLDTGQPHRQTPVYYDETTGGRIFLAGRGSDVEVDERRNVELLKERSWFDIPIVYANGSRAILTMEKGASGERALAAAFAAWKT
jgi:hypothetical protein